MREGDGGGVDEPRELRLDGTIYDLHLLTIAQYKCCKLLNSRKACEWTIVIDFLFISLLFCTHMIRTQRIIIDTL